MASGSDLTGLTDADLSLERPNSTLAEVAADKLRELILLEKLVPGAHISEREVSTALGISRTPLRAALAILEQEGLVNYSVTRRPSVADPSLDEITANLQVLSALEGLAGELTCAAATEVEIGRIVALADHLEEGAYSLDPLDYFRVDMEMHESIARASGNRALATTHRQYNARLWRARYRSSRRAGARPRTTAEHRAIAEALEARDGARAALALRTHLATVIANIRVEMAPDTSDTGD